MQKYKPKKKKKSNQASGVFKGIWIALLFFSVFILVQNRKQLYSYYKKTTVSKPLFSKNESHYTHATKIFDAHDNHTFGIDVSHYQGKINWSENMSLYNEIPIDFVILRASAGSNVADKKFKTNYKQAKKYKYALGAYHYYRPNENSTLQAENFLKQTQYLKFHFPPILDIERVPKTQSMERLKEGLKNWLQIVERKTGRKPILYSGEHFYETHLQNDFSNYPLWIANYNFWRKSMEDDWHFWQFSEKGSVEGIKTPVDVNVSSYTKVELEKLMR